MRTLTIRKFVFSILVVFFGAGLWAQSFTEMTLLDRTLGKFQISMNPVNGSFSLADNSSGDSTLVLQREGYPYGSQFRLSLGGRILRFDEVVQFSQVAQDVNSLFVYYDLKDLGNLTLGFRVLSDDSLSVILRLRNLSDQNIYAQILLDTVLGELSGNHFSIQGDSVSRETGFVINSQRPAESSTLVAIDTSSTTDLASVVTPILGNKSETSLQVVLANLRRLAESSETFSINPNRNFNLLPFSVNDSAVLLTASAQSGSLVEFGFVLASDVLPIGSVDQALVSPMFDTAPRVTNSAISNRPGTPDPDSSTIESGATPSREVELMRLSEDLREVNLLLLKIDQQLLNSSQELNLESLRDQLDTIRRGSGL